MGEVVRAKLFAHGGSQAVRLPKAFRFEGAEVRIRKEGDCVILEPYVDPAERDWDAFWALIDAHKTGGPEDDWPEVEDLPTDLDRQAEDLTW